MRETRPMIRLLLILGLIALATAACSQPDTPTGPAQAVPGSEPAVAPGTPAVPLPSTATPESTTAGPSEEAPAPSPAPVAGAIPGLVPMPVPTPAAVTVSPLPEIVPSTPVSPVDVYDFTNVSVGSEHSCGLRSDGTILCWGNGWNGETEAPEGTFTAVSAGEGYTCGIRSDGSVACWGIWGIRYGMPPDDTGTYRWPEVPEGIFKAISTGKAHACGIKTDDTLECWGENRISVGDFAEDVGQATPPPGTFLSVSAVGSTSCGVTTENQLVCWGAGYEGAVSPVEGKFLSVSAGGCGVRIDNTVVCWGERYFVELPPPSGKFESVSAGYDNGCGVQLTGELECWGYHLRNAAPLGEFIAVSVSLSRRCAVRTDGAVACWGNNNWYDELGLQFGITCGVLPNRAMVCPGEDGYDLLARVHAAEWVHYYEHNGSPYPCAKGTDGAVVCWDPYREGFLGPIAREVVDFDSLGYSACWILADGTVGCWGEPRIGSPEGTFKSISVGDSVGAGYFACGVRTSGTITCWDDGGHWSNASMPDGIFKSVTAGSNRFCAIGMDDTETCFDGTFGILDGGGYYEHCVIRTDNTIECLDSLSSDTGLTSPPEGSFRSVSVADSYACAVKVGGAVVCWGSNARDGEVTGQADPPPGEFLSVSAGGLFTCGIRTDHTLACWGRVPDVLKNMSGIRQPPSEEPQPTATPDIWLLPLRDQLEWAKQQPGPLATNVHSVGRIYSFVGMMTEVEKAAMVEETEQLLEDLGPPKGEARAHTYARIWLDLIAAFSLSLDEFNSQRTKSEYLLQLPFYVFMPDYPALGFRYDGIGASGGVEGSYSTIFIDFVRSSETNPQLEPGKVDRLRITKGIDAEYGMAGTVYNSGGGEEVEFPNLKEAGAQEARYWVRYTVGGSGKKVQVAWVNPESNSYTHTSSDMSLEETLEVVSSLR